MKGLIVCLTIALALPLGAASSQPAKVERDISHQLTPNGQLPGIAVVPGQVINFHITETDLRCFTYNAKEIKTETPPPRNVGEAAPPPETVADLFIVHDEETMTYEIDVVSRAAELEERAKKIEATDKEAAKALRAEEARCQALTLLGPRTWTIPVQTFWRFAMTGGITGDTLTDRVFFLEKAKGPDPADKTKTVDGFIVHKNGAGQDRIRLGTAAMAHLYHSSAGWHGVSVVPVSFGVALQSSEVQYLVGASLRFGTRAFLTGGITVGKRSRLPNGISVDGFVTDQKALDNLPKRTEQGLFLAVSLSFFENNAAKLTGLIKKP